jgi:hypothetical protein
MTDQSMAGYCLGGHACREAISSELAPSLGIQAAANARFDNFLHESVQLGNKTTVSAALPALACRPLVASPFVLVLVCAVHV